MDNEIKMVISRGKVTFTRTTATRCSSWVLTAGSDPEIVLDTLADMLQELRPGQLTVLPSQENHGKVLLMQNDFPVSDGIAFQPPKQTVLGGLVDLGNAEPAS